VLATIGVSTLSSLVYGIAPRDLPSFALSTLVLFVVSMAACYVPARRAARVEPTIALRSE
jgi:putative ABC transport system permease protein